VKLSKEIKTAIFVLTGFALFIVGFNYLKSNDIFVRDNIFHAVYDNVEGLIVGTPVTIHGLQVGAVDKINLLQGNNGLLVRFRVDDQYRFSKNSIVKIYEAGLIGGKSLAIDPMNDGASSAQSGDTLQGIIEPGLTKLVNDKLTPLQDKIESMIHNADSLLLSFNNIIDASAQQQIKSSISDLNLAVSHFSSMSSYLNTSLTDENGKLKKTFDNLALLSDDLTKVSSSMTNANLDATFTDLGHAVQDLSSILAKLDEGEGSLGKIITKDDLHDSLEETNQQIQLLLEDMRLNPKRYVHFSLFGKKQVKYESPDQQ
jgi:phospholipid/cholesterol/gamma-HCH transport system substrate-binding protein